MKRLALLIVGEIKSLVFIEQVFFFTKLLSTLQNYFDNIDTYLILSLPEQTEHYCYCETAKDNLQQFFAIIKPRKFTLSCLQDDLVEIAMTQAMEQETSEYFYDTFFRIRPDSYLRVRDLNFLQTMQNRIYTSYKFDGFANDQIFIMNRTVFMHYWIPFLRYVYKHKKSFAFLNLPIFQQTFPGWIVSDYKKLQDWNLPWPFSMWPIDSEYDWKYNFDLQKTKNDGSLKKFLLQRAESLIEITK